MHKGITEAIVLAGGLGTRLRSAVPNLPKCMAPVAGKPFIEYVIDYYQGQGIDHFIFAVGYKKEFIEDFLKTKKMNYSLSAEDEPLGTGGAIRVACSVAKSNDVLVINGDTFFGINMPELYACHTKTAADCTLSLKEMTSFDRYGTVELDTGRSVKAFREKEWRQQGLINGGVYALTVSQFLKEDLSSRFSFEKDYLEKYVGIRQMSALKQDGYFIDIGIPEDYERAQHDFLTRMPFKPASDK